MRTLFITGTDTNCGKTYITCQLLEYFKQNNYKTCALKPVATGCNLVQGELVNDDVALIQGYQDDLRALNINPWRYSPPISPHIAASLVGETITFKELADFCFNSSWQEFDYVLIEGAGGLMVPLAYSQTSNTVKTWCDFLQAYPMEIMLVVGMRLGCLNHTLLTAHAIKSQGLSCVGWIANCLDPDMQELNANIETLRHALEWPLLATVHGNGKLQHLKFDAL